MTSQNGDGNEFDGDDKKDSADATSTRRDASGRNAGRDAGGGSSGRKKSRGRMVDAARTGVASDAVEDTVNRYRAMHDDSQHDAAARQGAYDELVNAYYDLVTDFYEFGWGQSFHFAPRHNHESFAASLARHEFYLPLRMNTYPGDHLLDLGCGVGGPMRAIARHAEASVTGINNNSYQVQKATEYSESEGLADRCKVVQGDFMNLPFDSNAFDGVYTIEATCHAPDRVGVFSEAFRVLKPGGRFAGYEWCLTPRYRDDNREHRRVKKGIEEGNGLPDLVRTEAIDAALEEAGFELIDTNDKARNNSAAIPWYQPLTVKDLSWRGLQRTTPGRLITNLTVATLEKLKLAPKGATEVSKLLDRAAADLVLGGQLGIFTPMYFFLARKPAN